MTIQEISQQPNLDDMVVLYTIDSTVVGGDLYRFTPGPLDGEPVLWDGNQYFPIPCESSGWEWSGQGSMPQPVLRVANINKVFLAAVNTFDDLVGCPVTRTRTFRRFLDTGSEPDSNACYPIDYYVIEQKTGQGKIWLEWNLSAKADQQGIRLPRRTVLQNSCSQRYRFWNGTAFEYANATCPYAGGVYFDKDGNQVLNPALDRCGKKLSDCRKRFGNNQLPTHAFPGVARVRV